MDVFMTETERVCESLDLSWFRIMRCATSYFEPSSPSRSLAIFPSGLVSCSFEQLSWSGFYLYKLTKKRRRSLDLFFRVLQTLIEYCSIIMKPLGGIKRRCGAQTR